MSDPSRILLDRTIPSVRKELAALQQVLEELRRHCPIADDAFSNLMIALTEAVNNAIVHGNRSDPARSVRYRVECLDDAVRCVVEDEGEGFDPATLADPTDPENLLRESGRGVFIIRSLMRDVQLTNTGSGMRVEFLAPRK